jgi:hypothetical protein
MMYRDRRSAVHVAVWASCQRDDLLLGAQAGEAMAARNRPRAPQALPPSC